MTPNEKGKAAWDRFLEDCKDEGIKPNLIIVPNDIVKDGMTKREAILVDHIIKTYLGSGVEFLEQEKPKEEPPVTEEA